MQLTTKAHGRWTVLCMTNFVHNEIYYIFTLEATYQSLQVLEIFLENLSDTRIRPLFCPSLWKHSSDFAQIYMVSNI